MIVHGIWARVHSDLNILISPIHMAPNVADDAKAHLNLVGDVLHQLLGVSHSHRSAIIVLSDIDFPSVSVGETADPFEVFGASALLERGIVGFVHHGFTIHSAGQLAWLSVACIVIPVFGQVPRRQSL